MSISPFRSRKWGITILGGGLYFSFTFAWNALAALIPQITAELGLTELQTGILLGVVALSIFLTWPILGPLTERVGPVRAMGIGICIVGVAALLRGWFDSFIELTILMSLLSMGGSTITYGLPSTLSSWFPKKQVGTPLGVVSTAAVLGIVACFELIPTISSMVGGWRMALAVSGLPAIVFGSLWILLGSHGPERDGASVPGLRSSWTLIRRPDVLVLVLAGIAYLFTTHSIYGWLAPLFIEQGVEHASATRLVALFTLGQVIGMLAIPWVADRLAARPLLLGCSGLLFTTAITLVAVLTATLAMKTVLVLIAGGAIGGVSPLLRTLPIETVSSGSVSTVIAMVFGIGCLGGFIGPVLVGTTLSLTGSAIAGFAVLALPGAVIVVLAGVFRHRSKPVAERSNT